MEIYTVWGRFNGYDVNALVKAADAVKAKAAFARKVGLVAKRATKIKGSTANDVFTAREYEHIKKAHVGSVHIYDEGT